MFVFKIIYELLFSIIIFASTVKGQRRVYGGAEANDSQIPYAVYLEMKVQGGRSTCTGCIIHEKWVISAAHCVTDEDGDELSPKRIKVTAGTSNINIINNAQVRSVKTVIRHEKYKQRLGKHDIALICVDEPFQFNKYVTKLSFSTSPWPQNSKQMWSNCTAAGWGLTDGKEETKILRFLNTTAKHGRKACPCIEKMYVLKRIICLPSIGDEGVCFGDSGGALVCDGYIVGVAHSVVDKRSCSSTKSPSKKIDCGSKFVYGTYMYTCPYLDWISESIPDLPSTPKSCDGSILSPKKFYTILMPHFLNILFNRFWQFTK